MPKKKNSKQKSYLLIAILFAVITIGITLSIKKSNSSFDITRINENVITASEQNVVSAHAVASAHASNDGEDREDGDYFILPEISTMSWADMEDFTSYEMQNGERVTVESEWEVTDNYRTELRGCDGETETCRIFTDVGDQDFTLTATYGNKSDSLDIEPGGTITNPFSDELPSWAQVEIISFKNREIINGYNDGTYGPGDEVTRGQFVLLIKRLAEYQGFNLDFATEGKDCNLFSDVYPSHYAYNAICTANNLGWFDGIQLGTSFNPDEVLKRDLAAQLVYNSMGESIYQMQFGYTLDEYEVDSMYNDFNDIDENSNYYGAILLLDDIGIMSGNNDNFNPQGNLNRAQAAVILWRSKYMMEWSN